MLYLIYHLNYYQNSYHNYRYLDFVIGCINQQICTTLNTVYNVNIFFTFKSAINSLYSLMIESVETNSKLLVHKVISSFKSIFLL
jgi:hypothetical protein